MKYKYKDKIYFTQDLLEEFEKDGGNKELAKDLYDYFYTKLDQTNKKTDALVFRIPKFGNLYHNLTTLMKFDVQTAKNVKRFEGKTKEQYKQRHEVIKSKLVEIRKRITEAHNKGIKRIWFLWRKWIPLFKNQP
jgi:hypothetical protein